MKLHELLDLSLLAQHMKAGDVSIQRHPEFLELEILNYTQQCVFARNWDDITTKTRGLIWNVETEEVVARPFEKFWSQEQLDGLGMKMPAGQFRIFDKADGSLGIGYYKPDGSYAIATRGSFTSDQALHATEVWKRQYGNLVPRTNRTPLFEIVYPDNRIVLDYEGLDDLIYLGVKDIETGEEYGPEDWFFGPRVEQYTEMQAERANKEGYVLWWPAERFRLKVKHEEYLRIHRLIFGANTKTVWRSLADGIDPLAIDGMPDEFMPAIEKLVEKFRHDFETIEMRVVRVWRDALPFQNRKAQANYLSRIGDRTISAAVFKLLDGKSYDDVIWKALEPERALPIW